MDNQNRTQLTFSVKEATEVRQAYAIYIATSGEQKNINQWMKSIIMKKVKE